MADRTRIEWTDATWNPITGCTLVSEGCRHCYAATLAAGRLRNHPSRAGLARINAAGEAKFTGDVRLNEQWLDQPLRWSKPRRIFVCAHGDLFHEAVPDEWIDRVFAVMALAPQHVFQVLTKRPERARKYLTALEAPHREREIREAGRKAAAKLADLYDLTRRITALPLPNVWLGTSVEDQATADERIPHLLTATAAVRFLSAEPLLGALLVRDHWLIQHHEGSARIDWIIVGGESGHGARPMHPDWARSLRAQCAAAGVAFFFKQWGAWAPGEIVGPNLRPLDAATWWNDGWRIERVGAANPDDHADDEPDVFRVGKKAAGRLLDGREHNEVPHG